MNHVGAEPILDSFLAVALIGGGLLLLLLVSPRFGALSRFRKLALVLLRAVVIGLIVLALLRPTYITTLHEPRSSVLLILVDQSRSMQLPSGGGVESRWQAQQTALASASGPLANLAKQMDVRVYAYDQKLHRLNFEAGQIPLPEKPLGEQTDIGATLAEALQAEHGKRLAGVLLLGDGAQTAFDPKVEAPEAARKVRDDFDAPLYTLTFGPAGDAAQARDVAVERLDEEFTVFVKNEISIRGLVRIRGYTKKAIPVELTIEDEQGNSQRIGEQSLRAEEDDRQVEAIFNYTPQKVGHFRLTMSAALQPGELVAKNNSLSAYLTVLDGGLRILYVDGEKRFEQKFLRRSINASPDLELDDRIVDRRTKSRWPIDLGADLAANKYDAFILGDLSAAALGPKNLATIADQVGKGKGLLMIGGRSSFGWGNYQPTPIADLLPIKMDPLEGKEDLGEAARDRFFLDGPLAMAPVDPHSVTRLDPDDRNAAAWRRLPPLAWANKFAGVKEAPGVRVLLATARGEPLLVSGEYGRGRVLAFAGESTYFWPMHGFEKEHKRFWRQAILWLARRDDLERNDVWLKLDQRRFYPGARVAVSAGARTGAGDAVVGLSLETTLVTPDGKRQPLRLSAGKDQFAGSVEVTAPGDYAIETVASVAGKPIGKARAEFLVFDRDVELSNPAADPDQMAALAAWTSEAGGRAVPPEQLSQLLAEIADKPQEYEERQTKWRLGGTAADSWLFFALLTGVLSGEWWLRKKWGLV